MNLSERPVHPSHRDGLQRVISKTMGVEPSKEHAAASLLNALVAPGVTYSELATVSERAMLRAIDRVQAKEQVEIPETRVDAILSLLSMVGPDLQHCESCGFLDLQLKAGKWAHSTSGACGYCRGVLRGVEFDPPVIAWTTGKVFDPGTEFDHDQIPLTVTAIHGILRDQGREVAGVLTRAMHTVDPTLTIVDVCAYLARDAGGPKLTPIAVLDALANPEKVALNASALTNLVTRANTARGMKVAIREDGQKVSVPSPSSYPSQVRKVSSKVIPKPVKDPTDPLMEPKEFMLAAKDVLAGYFSEPSRMQSFMWCTAYDYGNVPDGLTGQGRWQHVLSHAGPALKEILENVLKDYSGNATIRTLILGYLDESQVREVFHQLPMAQKQKVVMAGLGGSLEDHIGLSDFDALDAIVKRGSLVCAYRAMESLGYKIDLISMPATKNRW